MKKYKRSAFTLHPSSFILQQGFTLLELAVVVFILALMLAVSMPSFTGVGEGRLKSEAKRVASVIRYLNDTSFSTKETLQLKVDFRNKALRYEGPEGEKTEIFDALSGIELQSKGLISEGEVIIFFGPLGAQESFRFHLVSEKQDAGVVFNAASGRVKIKVGG